VNGGSGIDTARFFYDFSAYTFSFVGNDVIVDGPEDPDTFTTMNGLHFMWARSNGMTTILHEGRNPKPYFDTIYYLKDNPNVAAAAVNPLQHYLTYGANEGRNPSGLFNTLEYLAANPDVAEVDDVPTRDAGDRSVAPNREDVTLEHAGRFRTRARGCILGQVALEIILSDAPECIRIELLPVPRGLFCSCGVGAAACSAAAFRSFDSGQKSFSRRVPLRATPDRQRRHRSTRCGHSPEASHVCRRCR
jgi:hypothetical protein